MTTDAGLSESAQKTAKPKKRACRRCDILHSRNNIQVPRNYVRKTTGYYIYRRLAKSLQTRKDRQAFYFHIKLRSNCIYCTCTALFLYCMMEGIWSLRSSASPWNGLLYNGYSVNSFGNDKHEFNIYFSATSLKKVNLISLFHLQLEGDSLRLKL